MPAHLNTIFGVKSCTLYSASWYGAVGWGGAGNAFKNENFLYKREMYALLLGI